MPEVRLPPPKIRDLRLDLFRGLCLLMIYLNHIPGTVYEHFTSRNFGFSDAAEGFVFMSGVAAGLAYVTPFVAGFNWQGVGRVWRRAWTLYMVHAMLTLATLGMLAFGTMQLGAAPILARNDFGAFLSQPLGVHTGLPLLMHQIGYVNILPMYMVLLLMAPVMLWAGLRWPWRLWIASAFLWFMAGTYGWNLPNFPRAGGWFFDPFSWQFIFSTGLLTGVFLKQKRRFIPVWRSLQILSAAFLLLALASSQFSAVSAMVGKTLWSIQQLGVSRVFTAFDKTYVTAPRLFHIFALAYFISTLPLFHRISGHSALAPLCLMGRNALPVFALGTILGIAGQVIKAGQPQTLALDSALVLGGLVAQLAFAYALEKGRLAR